MREAIDPPKKKPGSRSLTQRRTGPALSLPIAQLDVGRLAVPPPPAPTDDEANGAKGRPVQSSLVRAKQILKLVDLQDSSSYDAITAAPPAVLDLLDQVMQTGPQS